MYLLKRSVMDFLRRLIVSLFQQAVRFFPRVENKRTTLVSSEDDKDSEGYAHIYQLSRCLIPFQPSGYIYYAPHGCPPGLEYLTVLDQLLVQQQVEYLDVLRDYEDKMKFTIKDCTNHNAFYAVALTGFRSSKCWRFINSIRILIINENEEEVLHLHHRVNCAFGCLPCCLDHLIVSTPPGEEIGTIYQEWSLFPKFRVCDANGKIHLRIRGPIATCTRCGKDVEFKVFLENNKIQIGRISKQWSGLLREVFTDADFVGITFPMDLDVKLKAVLLGACFLIDYMYYEELGQRQPQASRILEAGSFY